MVQGEYIAPIFPLETVVLFPRLRTPLHIFEPRFRQLTEAALAGDGRIVMAVVRPEQVGSMAGDPEVFRVACAGAIREHRRLPDGRFHIVLHGSERVRILSEPERPPAQLFRSAIVAPCPETLRTDTPGRIAAMRSRVIELVADLLADRAHDLAPERFRDIHDEPFVNALCNALPFSPAEKQCLLETDDIADRCAQLIEIVRFALAERNARRVPNSSARH